MSAPTSHLPLLGRLAGFRRFTVPEYHKLIEIGILTENDNLELLEGYLVHKMTRNPAHDTALALCGDLLQAALPAGWRIRGQCSVTLAESEPEPDLAVVRGDARTYTRRHPGPADIGLVVEVADSSLDGDRADKGRIYARDGLPVYWIINLVERQVEVYTMPSGPTTAPAYAQRTDSRVGDTVPFVLAGTTVAAFPVAELLP